MLEGDLRDMDILTLMKERRSIRKYQDKQVPRELVDKIVDQGFMPRTPEAVSAV